MPKVTDLPAVMDASVDDIVTNVITCLLIDWTFQSGGAITSELVKVPFEPEPVKPPGTVTTICRIK